MGLNEFGVVLPMPFYKKIGNKTFSKLEFKGTQMVMRNARK